MHARFHVPVFTAVLAPLLALGWALLALPAWPLVAALSLGAAIQIRTIQHFRDASERVRRMIDGAAQPIEAGLSMVAARLEALSHRATPVHPITRLPTRERLVAAVTEHDEAAGTPRLLALLRFDDFDRIAAFDPALANEALAELAARLTRAVGDGHLVAQVDRDCFVLWFAGQSEVEAARGEVEALMHLLTQDLPTATTTLSPLFAVGLATFGEDGREAASLLTRALSTQARPQRGANGAIRLAEPVSAAASRESFVLEQDLAQAIAGEQLTMMFQPLIDLPARRVVGAEALLRWQHPTMGAISPARFIPMVEQIGLSDQFGAWVLNAACREARRWRDSGLDGLRVAVNLSACQLVDPKLQEKIERTLERHHLEPRHLELELTETAAMTDAGRTLRLFRQLHDLGIALAIDDFGSGHSSLSYLKNLPFDKLKIDREFVTNLHEQPGSHAICRALVELGAGLGLRVLAEGVERREEVDTLARLGCTLFQGYFFSRPLSGDAFLAFAAAPERIHGLAAPVHTHLNRLEGRLSA